MKSTIRTFSIIWGILALIVAIALFIVSIVSVASKDAAVEQLVEEGYAYADAVSATETTTVLLFVFSGLSLLVTIYVFVLGAIVYKESLKKGARIALGVVALLLLILIPGILYLVDACRPEPKPAEAIDAPSEAQ